MVFSKSIFVTCTFLILYPAILGKGRLIRAIFGHPVFAPFARVTFGAYLIHPLLMMFLSYDDKKGSYYDYHELLLKFIGFTCLSYGISFLLSAIYESPVVTLDKEFLRPKSLNRAEKAKAAGAASADNNAEVSEITTLTGNEKDSKENHS